MAECAARLSQRWKRLRNWRRSMESIRILMISEKKAGNVTTVLPVWKCSGCRRTSRDSMIRLKPEKKVSRYRSVRKPSWCARVENCKRSMRSCYFVWITVVIKHWKQNLQDLTRLWNIWEKAGRVSQRQHRDLQHGRNRRLRPTRQSGILINLKPVRFRRANLQGWKKISHRCVRRSKKNVGIRTVHFVRSRKKNGKPKKS